MDDKENIAMLIEQGKWMAKKVDQIDTKVDSLLAFKWRIYGATAIIAAVCGGAIEIFAELARR